MDVISIRDSFLDMVCTFCQLGLGSEDRIQSEGCDTVRSCGHYPGLVIAFLIVVQSASTGYVKHDPAERLLGYAVILLDGDRPFLGNVCSLEGFLRAFILGADRYLLVSRIACWVKIISVCGLNFMDVVCAKLNV